MKDKNDTKKETDQKKVDQQNSELEELKEKAVNLENQLKRALADYQNLEKRIVEGRVQLSSWASANLVTKILPILDHLEKVIKLGGPVMSEEDKSKDWFKGVELAVQQLQGVLADEGLEEIVADGQFDPALHEAVDTKDGDDNIILEIIEKGYTLGGKVIKPAKVIVGKKGENNG